MLKNIRSIVFCLAAISFGTLRADSIFEENSFIFAVEIGNYLPHERFEFSIPSSLKLGSEYRFMPYLGAVGLLGFNYLAPSFNGTNFWPQSKTTTGRDVTLHLDGYFVFERQVGLRFYGSHFLSLGTDYEWALSAGIGNFEWHSGDFDFDARWGPWVGFYIWHNASRRVQVGLGIYNNFWDVGSISTIQSYPGGKIEGNFAGSHTNINLSFRFGF